MVRLVENAFIISKQIDISIYMLVNNSIKILSDSACRKKFLQVFLFKATTLTTGSSF